MNRLKYQPALDGLRGVAILGVLGFHFAQRFVTGGSLGVDVFFVLSGYLITSILRDEFAETGKIDYWAFVMRRVRRLLPALIALLSAYVLLAPIYFRPIVSRTWLDVGTALFYSTNLLRSFWPFETPLSHTWSLAIEEQFYAVWPFIVPILVGFSRRKSIAFLYGLWLALTVARILCWMAVPNAPVSYFFTPFHATGLVLGSALAMHPLRIARSLIFAIALAFLFFLGHTDVTSPFAIAAAEVLSVALIAAPPDFLSIGPLRFLGRISYGIYLWHIPIAWIFGFPHTIIEIAVFVGASILAGWLSHVLIERPFQGFRRPHPSQWKVAAEA